MNMRTKICWLEPLAIAILLFSFGWQCLEEHTNQMKMEGYVFELNEKMLCIWEGIYDEALHSTRYTGNAIGWVNYDSLNTQIRDWKQIQDELSTINRQVNLFFWIRAILYVLGTIFLILAKWPLKYDER